MKAVVENKNEFKPFELAIKIETKRELEFLWCVFNQTWTGASINATGSICGENIKPFSTGDPDPRRESDSDVSQIWIILNNKLKSIQ